MDFKELTELSAARTRGTWGVMRQHKALKNQARLIIGDTLLDTPIPFLHDADLIATWVNLSEEICDIYSAAETLIKYDPHEGDEYLRDQLKNAVAAFKRKLGEL